MTTRYLLVGAFAAAMCVFAAGRNWAQNNDLNVQFHAFQDSRSVTVLTPDVDLSKDFTERTSLRVNFGVDAISAASDSCARCHRDGVRTRRQVGGLSVTQKRGDTKFTIGGAYSQENFYRATSRYSTPRRNARIKSPATRTERLRRH
jgi:hypothetical protein